MYGIFTLIISVLLRPKKAQQALIIASCLKQRKIRFDIDFSRIDFR